MSRPLPDDQEGRLAHCVRTYGRLAQRYEGRTAHLMTDEVNWFAGMLRPGASVLDAGCGPGRDLARFAAVGLAPSGVDLCPEFVAMAAERVSGGRVAGSDRAVPVVLADLRDLPLLDATYDAVWASASLVHLEQPQAGLAMAELRRVARPGALGYVSVKTGRRGWRRRADGSRRWFEGWSHDELAQAMGLAGWRARLVTVSEEWVTAWAVAGS